MSDPTRNTTPKDSAPTDRRGDGTDRMRGGGGYCDPPVASRFRPGHSGNPKGRPPGSRSARKIVEAIASETRTIQGKNGPERMTTLELVLLSIANKAMEGDARCVEFLDSYIDRYGPPPRPEGAGFLIVPSPVSEKEWRREVGKNQRKYRTASRIEEEDSSDI